MGIFRSVLWEEPERYALSVHSLPGSALGFVLGTTGFCRPARPWPLTVLRSHKLLLAPQRQWVSFPGSDWTTPVLSLWLSRVCWQWPGSRRCRTVLTTSELFPGRALGSWSSWKSFPGSPGSDRLLCITSGLHLALFPSHLAKSGLPEILGNARRSQRGRPLS